MLLQRVEGKNDVCRSLGKKKEDFSMTSPVSIRGLEIKSWEGDRRWPQAKTRKLDFSLTWWQLALKEKGGVRTDVVVNRRKTVCSEMGVCVCI